PRLPQLVDAKVVAATLGIGRSAAYEVMNKLPEVVRIGNSLRIPVEALERFISQGGDLCRDTGQSTSSFAAASGGRGSTTTKARRSADPPDKRTAHWRSKLQS
ncbi:MAG: hypothetical protein KBB95_09820, partial [Deltaproteobacteria bacterium]|nr:hypothetical protein [Deltaproteobacteria bacterium]